MLYFTYADLIVVCLIQDSLILGQLLFTLAYTALSEIGIHAQGRIKIKWGPGPKQFIFV